MDDARRLGEGGNFIPGEDDRFAGPEYGRFAICTGPGKDFLMARKIEGVTAQFAGFRIWKRYPYTLALHDLANACRNLLQQLRQLQLGHDPVRQIEKKLQSFVR